MAEPIDINVYVGEDFPSPELEDYWFQVTTLLANEPSIDMSLAVFREGKATPYFESIWNQAASQLGKENLDTNVILSINGYASSEFDALWEDLIT